MTHYQIPHTHNLIMGSISHHPQENSINNYRVFASFCAKGSTIHNNSNISNWIECYNPSNNTWHRVSPIPGLIENHVRKGFAMVAIADSLYVIGGRLCHRELCYDVDEIVEVDLEILSSVLCYNVGSDSWSKCAPLGLPRFDFACVVLDNKIHVAGGQCALGSGRGTSSAEVYDPALDQWQSLPSMSTLRYRCVGVAWQGKIHVVGGFAATGDVSITTIPGPYVLERSSAEVYDAERATWDFIPRMWELDVPPNQIVAINERLFSSGDCYKLWKGHIEVYDRKLNMWNKVEGSDLDHLSSSPSSTSDNINGKNWPPLQRLYLTMAPIGTHLYFLAGYRMPGDLMRLRSEVHVFDTSADGNGWRSFDPLEEETEKQLCCHCCVLKQ